MPDEGGQLPGEAEVPGEADVPGSLAAGVADGAGMSPAAMNQDGLDVPSRALWLVSGSSDVTLKVSPEPASVSTHRSMLNPSARRKAPAGAALRITNRQGAHRLFVPPVGIFGMFEIP